MIPDDVLSQGDTVSTSETQSSDYSYGEFYNRIHLSDVHVNLPIRPTRSNRSAVGADGITRAAGTPLEGGFEEDANRTYSSVL